MLKFFENLMNFRPFLVFSVSTFQKTFPGYLRTFVEAQYLKNDNNNISIVFERANYGWNDICYYRYWIVYQKYHTIIIVFITPLYDKRIGTRNEIKSGGMPISYTKNKQKATIVRVAQLSKVWTDEESVCASNKYERDWRWL